MGRERWEREAYSFAKTPLKAAQAPLATARAIHEGDLKLILSMGGGGGRREPWVGVNEGRRGSAAASIAGFFRDGGSRGGSGGVRRKGKERSGNLKRGQRYSTCNGILCFYEAHNATSITFIVPVEFI